MEDESLAAHVIRRIAAELGVPVASFYEQGGTPCSDGEAIQQAVAALLGAFAAVRDPKERQRSVAVLDAETERLRNLPDGTI